MVNCLSCSSAICSNNPRACLACVAAKCSDPTLGLTAAFTNTASNTLSRRQDNTDATNNWGSDPSTSRTGAIIGITLVCVVVILSFWLEHLRRQKRRAREAQLQRQLDRIEEGTARVVGGIPAETGVWLNGKPIPINPTGPAYHMGRKIDTIGDAMGGSWANSRIDDYQHLQPRQDKMPEYEEVPLVR